MSLPPAIARLIAESIALERSGEVGIALQRAREALDAAHASGEREVIAAALNCVAAVLFRIGTYEQVCPLAEEALAIAPADTPSRADALLLPGMCTLAYDCAPLCFPSGSGKLQRKSLSSGSPNRLPKTLPTITFITMALAEPTS